MKLEEIKIFLRVDEEEDDELISSLHLAAESYIENATGIVKEMIIDREQLLSLYNLTLKILITHWYENRSVEITGSNFNKLSFSLDTLFLQLEAEYLKMKRIERGNRI